MQNSSHQLTMRRLLPILLSLFPLLSYADDELPVIRIVTIDSQMPSCVVVYAPEGCTGTSIADNQYVAGRMTITLKDDTLYDSGNYLKGESGMRIKRRGNSTGAFLDQHPYKLKLSKKADLLMRDNKTFRHKEWVLLSLYTWNVKMSNHESNVLNICGSLISNVLEKEWVPAYTFVQVYLNDEYQGMYYLMESVDKGQSRVDISKTGFLIEHDIFWWNEHVYFRTQHQNPVTGFTFKYPDDEDVNDSIQSVIADYVNEFEDTLYNHGDISKYIDLESFARWLLIHDILGTDDAGGCNQFLYKYDLGSNPYQSRMKMGPVWDYDSMFRSDSWSALHTTEWFYFHLLLQREDFRQIYYALWEKARQNILPKIETELNQIIATYEGAFDKGIALHHTKYRDEARQGFRAQIEEAKDKLIERIQLLDRLMANDFSGIRNVDAPCIDDNTIYDLYGRKTKTPVRGIFIKNGRKYIR